MNKLNTLPQPTIAFIGGGSTGQNAAEYLNAIESGHVDGVDSAHVYAIVTTGDNGGATGGLREKYGGNANGDVRRSTSALSSNSYAAHEFESRMGPAASVDEALSAFDAVSERLETSLSYSAASLHPDRRSRILSNARSLAADIYTENPQLFSKVALGHLVIQALDLEKGDFQAALDEAGQLMDTRGHVIAASTVPHNVVMRDGDTIIFGEHQIDEHVIQNPDDVELALSPIDPADRVILHPRAQQVIESADEVVVGPGSVYTSIVPALLPEGMPDALAKVKQRGGELAIVTNLVTQPTETKGWTARRYVKTAEDYAETKFTKVIVNDNTADLPEDRAVRFNREEFIQEAGHLQVHATNLVKKAQIERDPNDTLVRSDVAHDLGAAAAALTPARA